MGKLNFRGYLISRFYPTREIHENLMHAKNMFYSNWLPASLFSSDLTQLTFKSKLKKPILALNSSRQHCLAPLWRHWWLQHRTQIRLRTDPGNSWKVMVFKIQIFQPWKVMEFPLGLGPGKSRKVVENKPNGCRIFDPCTCFRPLHTLSLTTVSPAACIALQSRRWKRQTQLISKLNNFYRSWRMTGAVQSWLDWF